MIVRLYNQYINANFNMSEKMSSIVKTFRYDWVFQIF